MLRFYYRTALIITLIVTALASVSCDSNGKGQKADNVDRKQLKKEVEEANRNLVKLEQGNIDEYVKMRGVEFVETGTGLRYYIENEGEGELIEHGDIVTMEYVSCLLNGDTLYSSKEDGLKVFMVGRGGVESGLEEAVLHLRKGNEAEIVIPSYLAHGLIGDGVRIPPKSTVVYKVKIIDNQTNK